MARSNLLVSSLFISFSALFWLSLMYTPVLALEYNVPAKVSQGHAFLVEVTDTESFDASFHWRGEYLPVKASRIPDQQLWKAKILLALPLDANTSMDGHTLSISCIQKQHQIHRRFSIKALPVSWPQSILSVQPHYVKPPQKTLDKIARDTRHSKAALNFRSEHCYWTLPLSRPVSGGITSPFGGRRVFNGQPRAPHKGTDLRSPEGAVVKAVASGTVILAEEHYYSGNTIYIDHGQGIISTYSHLSRFMVNKGDTVQAGQNIGCSGSTGRVTGPHLHLGFIVQGIAVDAMPLFEQPLQVTGGPSHSIFETSAPQSSSGKKP
jgi:murein DD-endopeptidase MepM/ murein hydrolase activator NlpD